MSTIYLEMLNIDWDQIDLKDNRGASLCEPHESTPFSHIQHWAATKLDPETTT